jgi:membrane protein
VLPYVKKLSTNYWSIIKSTVTGYLNDDSFLYAGSIAFSTIFSLPAIIIIALSIGSTFYERDLVQQELINQVAALIGSESTGQIEKIILNATYDMSSTFARFIGIATLIFSATTVFVSLQTSINKMWGIKPKPEKGWLKYIINRVLSFAMVVSFGFVLLVSLLIDTILVLVQNQMNIAANGLTAFLVSGVNLVVSLAIITLIFALLFKILPDAKIQWRDVWVGAFITTILFTLGKYLIGFYLGSSSINSAYGAAGSVVIILIWVYYSTLIFLFGAEFTSVYAAHLGKGVIPYKNAVKFKMVEVPQENNYEED